MRGIKIPLQDFALKMQGVLMREGGGGVFAGHYGTCIPYNNLAGQFLYLRQLTQHIKCLVSISLCSHLKILC